MHSVALQDCRIFGRRTSICILTFFCVDEAQAKRVICLSSATVLSDVSFREHDCSRLITVVPEHLNAQQSVRQCSAISRRPVYRGPMRDGMMKMREEMKQSTKYNYSSIQVS